MSRAAHLVRALIPGVPLTVDQACERLTTGFPAWVIASWLAEFGYIRHGQIPTLPALKRAVEERGERITNELINHRERSCRS